MQKYKVPDMSCGHCVITIEKTIHALDPKATVVCDLDHKEISITSDVPAETIAAALAQAGYPNESLAA